MKFVLVACMRACVNTCSLDRQRDLLAVLAHPAHLPSGHAHHQRIGLDVFIDHRACAHKSVFADGGAAYDGAVGTQSDALSYQGVAVFAFALNQGARVVDVGEHHAGAAEHALFQRDVVVHADVVLDFAMIVNDDLIAHEHVLTQRHAFADLRATTHVHKVPHAAALADLGAIVHDGAGVDGDVGVIQD